MARSRSTLSPAARSAATRVGNRARTFGNHHPETEAARLAAEKQALRDQAERVSKARQAYVDAVENWPELDDEAKDRIAAILRPAGGAA